MSCRQRSIADYIELLDWQLVMSSILEEVVNIIGKPAERRTDEELGRLLPWFRKKSDVFRSLKPGILFLDLSSQDLWWV